MTERVKRLKSRMIVDKQSIGIEKFKITVRTQQECYGWPNILLRGQILNNVLREMPIFIEDDQILVGNPASKPWGLEIDAGLGKWDKDELDALRADGFGLSLEDEEEVLRLNEQFNPFGMYQGANLAVADNDRMNAFAISGMQLAPWKRDKKLGNRVGGGAACSGLGNGPGWFLICMDFDYALNTGLRAMLDRIEEKIQSNTFFDPRSYERAITWKAYKLVLEGMIEYAHRYVDLATKMAGEEKNKKRRAELLEIAEICKRVPEYPARTFREALQFFWFIFLLLNPAPTPAIGRFDQYMFPFYDADIQAGRITDEEVLELLEILRIRCMEMNQQSGKEIRKRASGNARWINMTIGGVKKDGSDATNELTHLVLDAVMDCQCPHHTVTLRVAESTPDSIMLKAIKAQEMGCSMPAFVGDKSYINYFNMPDDPNDGVSIEDARNYCMTGCIDGNIPGVTRTMGITMFVCPLMLDVFLNGGVDRNTGEKIGNKYRELGEYNTYDEFEADFKQEFKMFMQTASEKLNIESVVFRDLLPDPMRSVFFNKDGIETGLDVYTRALDFESNQLMNPVGMVNLAQSLYAIKKLCFEEKTVTLPELKSALDANWEGYEELLAKCKNLDHYGNNISEIDDMVSMCYTWWVDIAESTGSALGGHYRCSAISVTSHQPGGALVGASPDGRHAKEILCDACASPMRGVDVNGPLAVFSSAMKIPQDRYQAFLMNMKVNPSTIKTDEDKLKLASAIRTYFNNGGKQVQFIVESAETLKDAHEHPEDHKDLMVRVAGYSTYFVQLTDGLQKEVIERTEHQI